MAFEKTWTFAYNQNPADQTSILAQSRSYLLALKNFLVASAGWVVVQSCDSITVASSDLWGSDPTKLVYGRNGTNPTSWIVLKSPAGLVAGADGSYLGDQSRLWLCLSCGNNYSNGVNSFPFIGRAGFHRIAPTGGTTTAHPTSASEQVITGVNYTASTQFVRESLYSTASFHFACTSQGNFLGMISYGSAGFVSGAIGILPVVSVQKHLATNQDYAYAAGCFASWLDSGLGALSAAQLAPNLSLRGWAHDGTVSTNNAATGMHLLCLGRADQANANDWIGTGFSSTGDSLNSQQLQGQLHLANSSAGRAAYIGRVPDIYGSGAPTPQGSVDNGATPTQVYIGNLWLPTNVAINL